MFEEGNQARRNGDKLLGRNIHVINPGRFDVHEVALGAASDTRGHEVPSVVNLRVGLSDNKLLLTIGGQIIDMVCYPALLHLAIRRFEETDVIDAGKGSQ